MLTIGEFARLAGVSARMLRHYDALGLLVPTRLDQVTEVPEGSAFRDLQAQPRAVTAVYVGAMAGIGPAWQELADYVRRAGLEFAGPCRELYLDVQGPEDSWVTELQQPVA